MTSARTAITAFPRPQTGLAKPDQRRASGAGNISKDSFASARPSFPPAPLLTVILLNYNGGPWLKRCLDSLRAQTICEQLEVVVADNASQDGSERLAAELVQDWPQARAQLLGTNLGYSAGNNRAAERVQGRYLFFLNNDTWLEPDCLERLLREMESAGAVAATPLVMDYTDGRIQFASYGGFDPFGLLSPQVNWSKRQDLFVAGGCSLLIKADWFQELGGFDPGFFMYADEYDLCWRVWLAGGKVVLVPSARLHHRSAAAVNPRGGGQMLEIRTSDTKRYYANRNGLLVLLKNSQHLLLAMVPLQIMLLATEALVMGALTWRWSCVKRTFADALWDCWRLRRHILAERRRLRTLRQHGDFWMLRFLRWRLNRWMELGRWFRFGLPKVDAS